MIKKFLFIIPFFAVGLAIAQTSTTTPSTSIKGDNICRVMFYNVENLFDTIDDPRTNDNEFLPASAKNWNTKKYKSKLINTYKVITQATPDILGLCEVENRAVLEILTQKTPLIKQNYQVIHYDSPDARGIDVALLYNPKQFFPIAHKPIAIAFPKMMSKGTTRDILYVKGTLKNKEEMHVFVTHWPSKYGGEKRSDPMRQYVAKVLREQIDSILNVNVAANILVMGDLNDDAKSPAILDFLMAKTATSFVIPRELYCLSCEQELINNAWTYNYQGQKSVIDHLILTGNMLQPKGKVSTSVNKVTILTQGLLMDDETTGDKKPFRTFQGEAYLGGFSDHLPIYIDIELR